MKYCGIDRFGETRPAGLGRSRSLHRLRFSLIEHCPSGRIPIRTGEPFACATWPARGAGGFPVLGIRSDVQGM